jgi:predicted small lipoprotein YifL
MKKLLYCLLLILFCVSLAGCGSEGMPQEQKKTTSTTSTSQPANNPDASTPGMNTSNIKYQGKITSNKSREYDSYHPSVYKYRDEEKRVTIYITVAGNYDGGVTMAVIPDDYKAVLK